MSLFKKKQPEVNKPADEAKEGKFRTFAYYLAWIAFVSTIGSAVFQALKGQNPPDKDDYYK